MFLHKNRDSLSRRMAFLRVASKGKHAWTGMGTPGYFSVNAGINDVGLAVAMNSGSKTDVATSEGISTSNLGRILLEECATAGDAVKLLEKIVEEGAYSHGDKGSIWFFVDGKEAIIVEQNARHLQASPVRSGIGIRANSWHYPEMLKHATGSVSDFMRNYLRENVIYKTLIEQCYYSKYIISQQDIWVASRCRSMTLEAIYPPCGKITNSAATLAIDIEFPAELSTAWIACGPPRHTVFMPVPITMTSFPEELLNGEFGDAAFLRFDKSGLDASVRKYVQLEQNMLSAYNDALDKARAFLKQGRKNEAAKLLEDAFLANWKYLKENEPFK